MDVNGASVHYATKERTPSTLVITEAMAITVDNLVVCEVEDVRRKSVQEQTDLSGLQETWTHNIKNAITGLTLVIKAKKLLPTLIQL